jgi:hypothetical protein
VAGLQVLLDNNMASEVPEVRLCFACDEPGHPCHICAGTGLAPAASAPGLGRGTDLRFDSRGHSLLSDFQVMAAMKQRGVVQQVRTILAVHRYSKVMHNQLAEYESMMNRV